MSKTLLARAAKLIEERAQSRWDSCSGNDGSGFICTDVPCGDSGSGQCRRKWKEMVDTAKALRRLSVPVGGRNDGR